MQTPDMPTAREIVDSFGNVQLACALGVPVGTVSAWKSRGTIPQAYWRKIEAEGKKLRLRGITYAALESTAKPRKRRKAASEDLDKILSSDNAN